MLNVLSKIAFSIGNLHVAWYAVIILSGALIGTIFGYFYFGKKLGITSDLVSEGLAFGLFFGILGARLYYVLFSLADHNYSSFIEVINPMNGGLAIHGGLIAVGIFLPIWCKIRHIDVITLLEIALPLIMFAQAVGRWGNFVNQEAYGPETTREFLKSLLLPNFIVDNMYIDGAYHHPTFLYESFFNLIGLTTYQIVRKYVKKFYVGDAVSFYLVWYGVVRFFIEILRTDALIIGSSGIKIAQVVSITMVVVGILIFILRRVFKFRLISCYDALYGEDATMMTKRKVLIFDCDGTIMDTFELIEKTVLSTFKELRPDYEISLDEAHSFFGPFINETFQKYVTDDVSLDDYLNTYDKYMNEYRNDYLHIYPNMDKALRKLKNYGFTIVIASNKKSSEIKEELQLFKIDKYVNSILGAEQMEKVKPDPYCVNYFKEKYHEEKVVMIGDSPLDIKAGIAASAFTWAVTWCKEKKEDFSDLRVDETIDEPMDLVHLATSYQKIL